MQKKESQESRTFIKVFLFWIWVWYKYLNNLFTLCVWKTKTYLFM